MRSFFNWRKQRAKGLVLLYHRVAEPGIDPWELCVSPRHFEEHLQVLKEFRPIRLTEVLDSKQPDSVVVTFDDGYADNLHNGAKSLAEYNIPATFFLTTGYLGGKGEFWWDELERRVACAAESSSRLELTIRNRSLGWDLIQSPDWKQAWLPVYFELYDLLQPLADEERRPILEQIGPGGRYDRARDSHRVLDMDEVSRLGAMDLVEIGAHTVTHPRLAAHSGKDQLAEMRESKRFLETVTARTIGSFSYPYGGCGHYSPESVEMAEQAGFSLACTTTAQTVNSKCNRFELPRVVINDIDGDRFEYLLNCYLTNKN
jgi:peptidoglycan/xylan/chitin deacetylase (PgdA/CDA1 family)